MAEYYGGSGHSEAYHKPIFWVNDDGDDAATMVVNGREIMEVRPSLFSNLETGGATTINATMKLFCPPVGERGVESAALYIRVPHYSGNTTDFSNGIYIEQPVEQAWTSGAGIKIIHKGAGDAYYCAMLGDNTATGADDDEAPSGGGGLGGGFGYEAASFRDRQSLYIATWQGLGNGGSEFPESKADQSNCIAYTALIHDDSTDPVTGGWDPFVLNNGAFLARNVPNNAFVAWLSDYAPSGYPIFHLKDFDQNTKWGVYTDGSAYYDSIPATSGSQTENAPTINLRSHYWDGDSSETRQVTLTNQVATTPQSILRFDMGAPGSETLAMQLAETGDLNIAGNFTNSGTTIRVTGRRTVTNSDDAGNDGDVCFDTDYAYFCVGASTWKRAALSTW